jgi:hypothetical protein
VGPLWSIAKPTGAPMTSPWRHPALILATLAVLSAGLGTNVQGPGFADIPGPGLYLTLTGVWFGLVVAFGVWQWGNPSWVAAATAFLATWIGWELAVNVAIQLEEHWLKMTPLPDRLTLYVSGFSAGAVGAFLTWAGAAMFAPALRQTYLPILFVATGSLLGLLLPCTNRYDSAAVLLLPWETAIAALLGLGLGRADACCGRSDGGDRR